MMKPTHERVLRWVGKRSAPCRTCQSAISYVHPKLGLRCVSCHKPKSRGDVLGLLILIQPPGYDHPVWADYSEECRLMKEAEETGDDVDRLRAWKRIQSVGDIQWEPKTSTP